MAWPGQPAFAAGTRTVQLRWEDVGGLIQGEEVTIVLTPPGAVAGEPPAGAARSGAKGRVDRVTSNAIIFADPASLPIPREQVAEIRMVAYVGNGRSIGKKLGGVAGLTAGLVGAVAIGLQEDAETLERRKALAAVVGVGGLPAGLVVGYLLGRQADKEITLIQIIPEAVAR